MNDLLQQTLEALKHGVTHMDPQAAVQNISAWQDALRDVPGSEALLDALAPLKDKLGQNDLTDAVDLMQKVGVQITLLAPSVPSQDDKEGLFELSNALNSPNI